MEEDEKYMDVQNATIHDLLLEVRKKQQELKKKITDRIKEIKEDKDGKYKNNDKFKIFKDFALDEGYGSIKKYPNYIWIKLKATNRNKDELYWITLFGNDIDTGTGNVHTSLNQIMFWKNVGADGEGQINQIICKCKEDYATVNLGYPNKGIKPKKCHRKAMLCSISLGEYPYKKNDNEEGSIEEILDKKIEEILIEFAEFIEKSKK
jgi:hypothetical protein